MGIAPGRRHGRFVWIAFAAALTAAGLGVAGAWRWSAQPMEQGWSAYRQGRWREALSLASQRLKEDRNDREALRLMARASARLQLDQMTTALYLRLGSENAQAEDFFLLGEGLMRQGKDTEGEQMWRKALTAEPTHAETLSELTRRFARTDRLAEGADLAVRLGELPGWEARATALLGGIKLAQADPASAVEAFQRALRLDPEVHETGFTPQELRKRLARALLQLHRPAEAEADLRTVLNLGPDPEAEWLISRAALQQGDRATALAAWRSATSAGATVSPEPSPYVGSARCAECHGEVYENQQSSRHARTFYHADQVDALNLPSQTYNDPDNPGVVSTVTPVTTPATLRVAAGPEIIHAVMDYILGSGRHAFTPLGRDDEGVTRELRLTYYAAISSWDRTPGHPAGPSDWHGFLGERQTDDSLRRCLSCHTTNYLAAITKTGPEAVDRGIGCERCHGPGGNHVAAVEASFPDLAIEKFRRNAPGASAQVMTLCGGCHGPQGRPVDENDPATTVRFQALTLAWSKCYSMSRQTLDCLTCHSAHGNLDETPGFYEAKCLSCHTVETPTPEGQTRTAATGPDLPRRVACPVNPRLDCAKCHMPKVPSMVHAAFTDHNIRVHPGAAADSGPRPR